VSSDPAAQLKRLLGTGVASVERIGGQHGVGHFMMKLTSGRVAFAKVSAAGAGLERPTATADGANGSAGPGFAAEASGLSWLAAAGAVAIPEVLAWDESALVIDWISESRPDARAALTFGRELAALHAAGADSFGAPWPGTIAGLPLPSDQWPPDRGWADWYAAARLLPYVRLARDRGGLTAADAAVVEAAAGRVTAVAGPAEPPARIHGDCWSGNVLWSAGRGWLIDPAAHGGHRETDLAMLALFGAPYLDRIMAGYQEVAPLADGWRARIPLHQLHPLLVHVCLFGASYSGPTLTAARAVLAS
jgi:fructosamine-3-kinase